MKGLFPEEYGLVGRELAAAAVVKFYVGEVDGTRAELEGIIGNGSVDGLALVAFIDRAVTYSQGRAQINKLQQVKGMLIVQDIGVDLLDFLMDCCKYFQYASATKCALQVVEEEQSVE